MAHLFTTLENSPAILVSIVFFIGWTASLWGLPALRELLKGTADSE